MMRAPPHEPQIQRSRTAMPSIPIQTMTLGTVGDSGPTVEATATFTLAVPQEARIGGLKLEMPEKYIGSRIPAISGWLTKMERYFRLMKYPTNIWVDVIATCITDGCPSLVGQGIARFAVGPWRLPLGQLGRVLAMKWSRLSPLCQKWNMREGN